jgi:hypothetical protein
MQIFIIIILLLTAYFVFSKHFIIMKRSSIVEDKNIIKIDSDYLEEKLEDFLDSLNKANEAKSNEYSMFYLGLIEFIKELKSKSI